MPVSASEEIKSKAKNKIIYLNKLKNTFAMFLTIFCFFFLFFSSSLYNVCLPWLRSLLYDHNHFPVKFTIFHIRAFVVCINLYILSNEEIQQNLQQLLVMHAIFVGSIWLLLNLCLHELKIIAEDAKTSTQLLK